MNNHGTSCLNGDEKGVPRGGEGTTCLRTSRSVAARRRGHYKDKEQSLPALRAHLVFSFGCVDGTPPVEWKPIVLEEFLTFVEVSAEFG